MSLRLALAGFYLPRFVRRREFFRLVALTAEAFDAPRPALSGRTFGEKLDAYARWTRAQAEGVIPNPERAAAVQARLRGRAFEFGSRLRTILGVRTRKDVMRAGRVLYRVLLIDFRGEDGGEIVIDRCFFCRVYSPEICAMISFLDEGVLAGLAGGGRLEFSTRITQNDRVCRARFAFPEDLA